MSGEWRVESGEWRDKNQNLKFFIILFFMALTVFACTEKKSSRDGIVIADSKKYEASIYRQNCAICHGKEAYGKTLVDESKVPPLRFGKAKTKTREEIYQQINNGKNPMPSFKDTLNEKEVQQMVDFIMYDIQAREREKDSE